MKKIKKLSLIIVLILAANIKVFAASGFEAALSVPLGASFGIFDGEMTTYGSSPAINSEVGFNSGVKVQLGYMFDFGGFGLSLLGELGYSYDSYRISLSYSFTPFNGVTTSIKSYSSTYLHNFQIGVLPKFNFGDFALGIGGGVKIPMAGTEENKIETTTGYSTSTSTSKLKYSSSDYKSNVIGYIKATFDYSFFFADNMAFVLGTYMGYDITPSFKGTDNRLDSFYIGAELGFKFGPRVGY
ncbi:hypothetical protein E6A50_02070 [Brachyspira hampsonii]|nr:hypothetical protein [Brachyspira hampsonii]